MPSGKAPLTQHLDADCPAAGTAAGTVQVVGEAPFDGAISDVTFTPSAAIVGSATNYATLKLRNAGAAGDGTAIIASKAFSAVGTAAAGDELSLVVDAARNVVAAGDVLELTTTASGGGLALPSGLAQVAVDRD